MIPQYVQFDIDHLAIPYDTLEIVLTSSILNREWSAYGASYFHCTPYWIMNGVCFIRVNNTAGTALPQRCN